MAAGVCWESPRGGGKLEGGAPLEQSKKIENASKNARHFSIFVPLMGVQILLEASVLMREK